MNKKSKKFIIIFFLIILISVVVIGVINYTKEQKLNDKIENSRTTKTLSLNNITSSITCDELFKIEMSREYIIEENELKYENDSNKDDFTVEYSNTSIFGSNCTKEYLFVDETLKMLIIEIETSHWKPKDIYTELVNINGEPDDYSLKKDELGSDIYYWYGKNGTIIYTDDNISNTIQIIFELNQ